MMLLLIAVLCISSLTVEVAGHAYSKSECPSPTVMENFDESRLLGKWRVEYAVKTTSSCLTMDFRKEGGTLKVYETKELSPAEKVGVEIKYGSVGTLAETATPGYYQASYSTSVISGRFVIMDTDYETYLVVFHCMQMSVLGSRRTVYLLSKDDNPISGSRLEQVKKDRLPEVQLKGGQLAKVSHENCVSADAADIDLTGPVSFKDIIKVVKTTGSVFQLLEALARLGK